jgi:hypothetical protein
MSLGFYGLGDCAGELDASGNCCTGQVDNGVCIPLTSDPVLITTGGSTTFDPSLVAAGGGYAIPAADITQSIAASDPSVPGTWQNAINAMSAAQWTAFQAMTPAQQTVYVAAHPASTSSSTYLIIGAFALVGLLLVMKK